MLTCLSRILVFCWCKHLWRSGQLFFVHFLMSVSGCRWWDHKPLLRIPGLVVGSWVSWFLLLFHFEKLPIGPIKIVCLQQEKWISGGKTFDILCLFCRSIHRSVWQLLGCWKKFKMVAVAMVTKIQNCRQIQKSSDLDEIWFPSRLWCCELIFIVGLLWWPFWIQNGHQNTKMAVFFRDLYNF